MSPKGRALIGVITTFVFLTSGGTLLLEQHHVIGGVLTALGVFRGMGAVKQLTRAYGPAEEEDQV